MKGKMTMAQGAGQCSQKQNTRMLPENWQLYLQKKIITTAHAKSIILSVCSLY